MSFRKRFTDISIPRYFTLLEDSLAKSASGWVCGDNATIADARLFQVLQWLTSGMLDGIPSSCISNYPKLVAFMDKMKTYPPVQSWYEKKGNSPYVTSDYVPWSLVWCTSSDRAYINKTINKFCLIRKPRIRSLLVSWKHVMSYEIKSRKIVRNSNIESHAWKISGLRFWVWQLISSWDSDEDFILKWLTSSLDGIYERMKTILSFTHEPREQWNVMSSTT